jgi:periplasmic protein TonB
MFADSLLETSWAYRGRRSWTTLTSFGLQAVIIGLLLLIPILTTVGLPTSRTVSTPIGAFRKNPDVAPRTPPGQIHQTQIVRYTGRLMAPGRIPNTVAKDDGPVVPSEGPAADPGIYIGPGVDSGPGIPIPMTGTRPVTPVPPPTVTRAFRPSNLLEGSLIRRVQPVYPPLARNARIQGPVVLAAVISKTGTIENLTLISGHPMLVPAALQAVSQWRYRPYILNGDAIEVDTQITVNFVLGQN